MTKVINLNKIRKARARDAARSEADRNAAFHGMTKAEKDRAKAEAKRETDRLDQGKLDPPRDDT